MGKIGTEGHRLLPREATVQLDLNCNTPVVQKQQLSCGLYMYTWWPVCRARLAWLLAATRGLAVYVSSWFLADGSLPVSLLCAQWHYSNRTSSAWAPNNTAPKDIPQWGGPYDQALGAEAMPTVRRPCQHSEAPGFAVLPSWIDRNPQRSAELLRLCFAVLRNRSTVGYC